MLKKYNCLPILIGQCFSPSWYCTYNKKLIWKKKQHYWKISFNYLYLCSNWYYSVYNKYFWILLWTFDAFCLQKTFLSNKNQCSIKASGAFTTSHVMQHIFSSPELKAQVSFSDHLSSVVCLSVCHLLLQNHWTNFNQTWQSASLGEEDSWLFKWKDPPFSKGR